MSFEQRQKQGHLKPHTPSRDELEKLYRVIRRDLKAAGNRKMDDDWRFAAAYNAALRRRILRGRLGIDWDGTIGRRFRRDSEVGDQRGPGQVNKIAGVREGFHSLLKCARVT